MTPHTPPPWEIDDRQGLTVGPCRIRYGTTARQKNEAFANAQLVSAAPLMLAALRVAAEAIRNFDGGDPSTATGWKHDELRKAWEQATNASAKAEHR